MTSTATCNMMNRAYEDLKTMTIEQLKEAAALSLSKMNARESALFRHQCNYAIMKKRSGAWA
jgi:hypothetical protein